MRIRNFTPDDIYLMNLWLEQDYIRKYWGEPQDWINEIMENINADWVKYFIVECDNAQIGFLQYYETDKAPQGDWSDEPVGTVGIDYLIGDTTFLGKGYGSEIVHLLVDYIKSSNKYKYIVADPITENIPSIKVLERNGFELSERGLFKLKLTDNCIN